MRKKIAILVCLLVCCLLVATAVVVADKPENPGGGKPPKDPPPPPEGTVYFQYNDGDGHDMWTMKADGSEKTQLGVYEGIDQGKTAFGEISRLKHGDHYWFIRFVAFESRYPDETHVREIFAVRDDGGMEVQLTNDPTLETGKSARALIWGINDDTIAWSAFRWVDGVMDMDSFGIYSLDISFDANGDVIEPTEAPHIIWNSGYWVGEQGKYRANVKRIDFSPDGSEMVLVKWNKLGGYELTWDVFVVNLGAQTENDLETTGHRVRWSPDGSKIAILQGRDLVTINPDGSDEQVIVASSSKAKSAKYVDEKIGWSPDSSHLLYTWKEVRYGNNGDVYTHSVRRVEANGDNPTSMTDDLPDNAGPKAHAWR